MDVTEMSSPVNLESMTKAELIATLQSQQTADAESSNILQQQARLLDLSYDAIFIWEWEDGIKYWNKAAEELYGWTREEAMGRRSHELLKTIHPEGWEQVEEALLRDGHWYGELTHRGRDGRRIVSDSRHVLMRQTDGRKFVLETNRDITARKQAENALRESKAFKLAILNSMAAHIAVIDRKGKIISVNEAWRRFARENGRKESEDCVGLNYFEICHRADSQSDTTAREAINGLQGVLDGSLHSFTFEYACHSPQEERWFLMTVTPLLNDGGGAVVSHINITERKLAEESLRKSEERLRLFIENNPVSVAMFDQEMRYLAVSPRWLQSYGVTDEVIGRSHYEVFPEIPERWKQVYQRCLAGSVEKSDEDRFERADGSVDWIKWEARPWFNGMGNIGGIMICSEDISERKRAELALRESEQQLSLALAAAAMGVWILEIPSNRVFWSPESYQLVGLDQMNPTLESFTSLIHPEDLARVTDAINAAIASRTLYEAEFRIIRPDGKTIWLSNYGRAIYDVEGQPQRLLGVAMDITERKRADEALRGSEARMGGIINSAMDAIISVNNQQRIVLFNRAAEKMFRYSAEEVLGQPLTRLVPARFQAAHEEHVRHFSQTGETTRAMGALSAVCGVRRNGEEFPIEASISQIEADGQKLFTVILRDITERQRANEQLIEQAALLDQSHEAIIVRNLGGYIRYWSRGAERLYGWTAEEAVGRSSVELHYRKDSSPLIEATRLVLENGEWNGELHHVTKDGREVIVEGHWTLVRDAEGNPKNILAINTDVTEKKKLEANFLRAQRLESIGTLASGIAHDLNNVLSPILMGTQMLQMKLHDDQSLRLLALMQANANRGAEMIKQVLSFSKGISGQRVVLQTKHLIREIVRIAEETFPKSVRIEQKLAEDLWTVSGDATRLHQVLLNLCVNARDAMPQGGSLTIRAENQSLDKLYAQMLKGAAPGNFVVITIADTGVGIPPEYLDRIFDPFFTTKEPGKGTGLGLATVQGIVTSHGGFITVESKLGLGTKFCVYLPANEITDYQKASEAIPTIFPGAGELILLIDDEAAVRETTSATLEAFGYRTMAADNGATALGIFAQHVNEISLVITDLMMPVMDGAATIRALRKINPKIPIIPTSGLADQAKIEELKVFQLNSLLEKPYNAETLLNMVASVLGRCAPPATNDES